MVDQSWLDQEIAAFRLNLTNDNSHGNLTREQSKAIHTLYGKCVKSKDRDVRIFILRELTGIPQLQSSNNLSFHMANVLITYFKKYKNDNNNWEISDDAKKLFSGLEERALATQCSPVGKKRHKPKSTTITWWDLLPKKEETTEEIPW